MSLPHITTRGNGWKFHVWETFFGGGWRQVQMRIPGNGPEVPFEAVNTPSDIFQSHVVIHRVSQFLFASQVMLGRLNRCVPKQKLDLFKFAASQVA
jgi:hypothetical protein